MKRIFLFLSLVVIALYGCNKDEMTAKAGDPETGKRDSILQTQFRVDKIYDFHNRLLAEYFYNEDHQLTKRSVYDPVNFPGIKISDIHCSYNDGRVSNIDVISYTHPQFNHNILIVYNESGQIIRDETYQQGNRIGSNNYRYDAQDRIRCLADEEGNENYFIDYKQTSNAIQVRIIRTQDGGIGNEITKIYRNFLYDDKPKPDFGLGKVFQIEPLPGFGGEAMIENNISGNNMTEFIGGTRWIYEYNENGLPATIETRWKDVETLEPILHRIQYKEI